MAKATTIKDAVKIWEEKNKKTAAEEDTVKLLFQIPPIEKMDASLSALAHVKQLSLSTNAIDKIANLGGFKNLKILSLARNNIKSIGGLEPVADTLEELWLSYNLIEKLKGLGVLKKCRVLYLGQNKIKDMKEIESLNDMPALEELVLKGNPIELATPDFHEVLKGKLKKVKKVDGIPIVREDAEE